jgi:hypothetical protein
MKLICSIISRLWLITTLTAAFVGLARADVIMDWNAKADAIAAEKQVLPAPHSRVISMMHVAMFEAVNAIDRRYTSYQLNLVADRSTSREAAAATAAHDVLLSLYPDLKSDLDAALATSLAAVADAESKSAGVELGRQAAQGIIALRANDGSAAPESYRPNTSPGVYVPTTVPLFSTVGATTPWILETARNSGQGRLLLSIPRHGPGTSMKFASLAPATARSARPSKPRSAGSGFSSVPVPTIRS